ncbi:outer membrane protein assembly factor BamA [Ottowia sp.]|jgi:outer membrane protein insertion porin family|uniref:outer membrane protein assembly factor BamA n=1 Tax=Ottowia sp. TaxID=1898956 RepID=UPI0025D94A5C|nr:outer membrane protein assembly factor BamA [Ottowia sp.]MBK6615941.1 outer membrane protein assembly factor BamA [Ottowia sp.]MBK6747063.1 outer membrane protein assembly factor BamA [Ottowia sp.]
MKSIAHRFRLRTLASVVSLALAAQMAWAVDPFTVRDIRVEGLQRVEAGTVFAPLPVRVGETYNDDKGAAAIRALFGLGLFTDVRLEVSGEVLVVIVQERPTIAAVEFAGNKEFTNEILQGALRDAGLAAGRPYDRALADRAEQELKRQYINRSLYGAEVVTTVTPTERNQVRLTFNLTEGRPARIKGIDIIGNQAFSDGRLKDLFDLDAGGWLSWYTKSDQYSRAKLNADLEALRSFYLARGYLDFKIDSTQVAMSPDKESITVTINVTEGDRFVVSGVSLDGRFLDKEDEFKSLITIKPGEAYNADQVAETTKAFTDHFGNYGYAFATVEAVPDIDRANNRVAVVLRADPSRRAYVRRINIQGNTRTRDEVIRREFRQYESSWYDAEKIRLSRDRVDRLGYFTELSVTTSEVSGAPDQVDLDVEVKEKPTGNISLGAGYSSAEKLSFTFGLAQENVFGSGNRLDLQLNTGKFNRTLVVSATDPYFTTNGVSRTVDVYYKTQKPYQDQGGNYTLITMGAGLKFGVPVTELDTVYLGMNAERTRIKPGTNIPAAYLAYANQFGYSSTAFPFTLGWSRDSRDSALAPNSGRYQRLMGELGLFGDARYVKANYQYQQYVPLSKQYTLAFNGELGWGKGLGGDPFPVFKNFYSGGLGSVRGYEQSTLGPRDVTGAFIGGTRKFTLNTEFIMPFPGAGNDRTLRLFGFVDVGALYGEGEKIGSEGLRYSTGIGFSWISPLGPLRFAFAVPLRKRAGDRIQRFQFQIGTSF